jgi:hypothetical protein
MITTILSRLYITTINLVYNIKVLNITQRLLSLLLAFLAPIKELFYLMFFFLITNLITGILKNVVKDKQKLSVQKMRYTLEKFLSYLVIMIMAYSFEHIIINTTNLYATRFITGLIALVEFKSVTENLEYYTNKKIFSEIYKKVEKIFTKSKL